MVSYLARFMRVVRNVNGETWILVFCDNFAVAYLGIVDVIN